MLVLAVRAFAQPASPPVYTLDLSGTESLPVGLSWVNEGPGGGACLKIEVAPGAPLEGRLLTLPIDLTPLRDQEILLSYDVRADGVSVPEQDYNGIKSQLHWTSVAQGPRWFNEGKLTGTFDWRRSALLIRVDGDAKDGVLQLGMQQCSGTAWLANVTLTIVRPKPDRGPFRGHDLPRLRGMMGAATYVPADLDEMARWNVNCLRWQLLNPAWDRTEIPGDPAIYGRWLDGKLNELDRVLEHAHSLGIRVIVDLHAPPGGRTEDGSLRMVMDRSLQQVFLDVWQKIARRYRGRPGVWAYDLMNEPVQTRPSPPGVMNWAELQVAAARAVRAIDPDTPILIATDQWNSPEAFAWMEPVDVPRVIYQVHVYWPHEYTHQGVDGPWDEAKRVVYPGTFNTRPFDVEAIRRHLAPVREFQKAYNVQIFVGEFSVVRWAPGGAKYLADCLALFEEYGWDWAFHAFREWPGWSLEHADQPYGRDEHPIAAEPPDRARVIRGWLDKNKR